MLIVAGLLLVLRIVSSLFVARVGLFGWLFMRERCCDVLVVWFWWVVVCLVWGAGVVVGW